MSFIFVCSFCNEHSSDDVTVEINAREQMIYFVCPKCHKRNDIDLKPKILQPSHQALPRAKFMR